MPGRSHNLVQAAARAIKKSSSCPTLFYRQDSDYEDDQMFLDDDVTPTASPPTERQLRPRGGSYDENDVHMTQFDNVDLIGITYDKVSLTDFGLIEDPLSCDDISLDNDSDASIEELQLGRKLSTLRVKVNSSFDLAGMFSEHLKDFQAARQEKIMTRAQVRFVNKLYMNHARLLLKKRHTELVQEKKAQEQKQVTFQICSDLHMEMFSKAKKARLLKEVVTPVSPILCLLGDIGTPACPVLVKDYKAFLLAQADQFKYVFVISGNHEYYINSFNQQVMTMHEIDALIQGICDSHPALHYLNRKSHVINNVRFVGCTLWSHIPEKREDKIRSSINDFHYIFVDKTRHPELAPDPFGDFTMTLSTFKLNDETRVLHPSDATKFHAEDVKFIVSEAMKAKDLGQKCVVLTHHPPTFHNTSNPKFSNSPLRFAFASELDGLFSGDDDFSDTSAISVWASGHTHWSCNQVIGGVKVVSNQFGYLNTSECTFSPSFLLRV